jgi:hypothetical protein
MNEENGEVGNRYGLRSRERNNCTGEEEENKEEEVQEEEEDNEGEEGREWQRQRVDEVYARILKRICTITIWRCQEN